MCTQRRQWRRFEHRELEKKAEKHIKKRNEEKREKKNDPSLGELGSGKDTVNCTESRRLHFSVFLSPFCCSSAFEFRFIYFSLFRSHLARHRHIGTQHSVCVRRRRRRYLCENMLLCAVASLLTQFPIQFLI